ncbi:MAG: DoxX family protein [Persicimonas sp.]
MAIDRYRLAPLPLRLIAGVGFIIHGFPKLFDSQAQAGFVEMLGGMGVPLPEVMAWVVGFIEFGGGIALILGALTAVFSALLAINMLVAMFMVHLPNGFLASEGGIEVPLLYLGMVLALLISGPGGFSVDRAVKHRREAGD